MSEIAQTLLVLALVACLGLWLGGLRLRGIGIGIAGVLFGGLILGDLCQRFDIQLDRHSLHFVKEFGLILFVYTIGIQVGPGFFASLQRSGLKLNLLALLVVLLGSSGVALAAWLSQQPLSALLGVYSGAVTNTPSLAAGQQIAAELGADAAQIGQLGMGYAMAYPAGVLGILLTLWLLRPLWGIRLDDEVQRARARLDGGKAALTTLNVRISNHNIEGLGHDELARLLTDDVLCSRIKRNGLLLLPDPTLRLQIGDIVHLVSGNGDSLRRAQVMLGDEVDESLSTKGTTLRSERVVVTAEGVLGRRLGEVDFHAAHKLVVSRLNRAGVELVPTRHSTLQFGDILNLVGDHEDVERAARVLGNVASKLQSVQMMPVFIGIALGVLLGSLPLFVPGIPSPLRLGLAGGPLLVALVLSRIGSIGKLYWFMPPSANLALRELGIVLFLAVVGLHSGAGFVERLLSVQGLVWIGIGSLITVVPLLIGATVARWAGLDYLSICGLLAGSMTDPPALQFASAIREDSDAAAVAYATVYPLAMCLRILSPQVLAVLLWVPVIS